MKIMKVFDKKVGDTTYYKYRINLPKKMVEQAHLQGKNLDVKLEGEEIIIQKIKIENLDQTKQNLTKRQKILQKELIKLIGSNKRA